MQNSVISTRMTSLYGFQPSSVVLACKSANFDWNKKYLSHRCNLFVLCIKQEWFAPEWQVYNGSSPHLMQNSDFKTRLTSLYGSQTSSVGLSTHNSVLSSRIKRLYGFQPSPVVLCMQTSDFWTRITSLYGYKTSPVALCMHNSAFWNRITILYGSKTSPVILCMQNSVPSIRITSLYESQPSSVVFGCKTATLGPDLQVCMGPRPHLWFWEHITACFAQE